MEAATMLYLLRQGFTCCPALFLLDRLPAWEPGKKSLGPHFSGPGLAMVHFAPVDTECCSASPSEFP